MPTFFGFILQPTYRVLSGVRVLHLFGRLEDGDLRKGRFDDQLVYRRSLRKAPEAYIATSRPTWPRPARWRERGAAGWPT